MASEEEIRKVRIAKLGTLKKEGMEAYPAKIPRDFSITDIRTKFDDLSKVGKPISLAGRLLARRGQGAIFFCDIDDGTAKIQAVFKKDSVAPRFWMLFNDAVDIGDILSVTGTLFKTDRGELSVQVSDWTMGAKSLLPLPEKWHGIEDPDERLRKRYLDMIMTPELRDIFVKKSKFWEVTRRFMVDHGFLEVETPTLEITTGGAEARPFKTHHNDFDVDVFLRISIGELWQKRLMAGGFPKTFEIGRAYRNEGTSPDHLQEFTNMEFYWSYADYKDGMKLVRELYIAIAKEVFGKTSFTTRNHTFDLASEWPLVDYSEEIKKQTGLDINTAKDKDIKTVLEKLQVPYTGNNRERLTDTLWKYCRKNISGPAFVVNHPVLIAPLAKVNTLTKGASELKTATVQMFQPLIAGSEVGRGYSELNDPIDQAKRFEEQGRLMEAGDEEAMMPDLEFVEMLEHGMPPTCGFGFGERLFAFLLDKPLREVQLFPLMKPKKS